MSIGASPFTSNYPGGFANGVSVRGIPLAQTHPGKAIWLYNGTATGNSATGADGNPGTFNKPCSTLAGALLKCLAGRGDIIFVKPGHAETISSATALNLNVSGVAVVGLGSQFLRPTFTLDTATTSTITVSADDVSIQNCRFIGNFGAIASLFTLTTAKGFTLQNCWIADTSSSLGFLSVITTSSTDNANNYLSVIGNKVYLSATSGVVNFISFLGSQFGVSVVGNDYRSATTNAGAVFPIATGKLVTALTMTNNLFNVVNAAGTATAYLITTNGTTNSGFIDGNMDHALPTSPLLVTASSGFVYGLNYHSNTADLQGYLVPGADS